MEVNLLCRLPNTTTEHPTFTPSDARWCSVRRALRSALVTGGMHNRLLSVVLLGGTAIIATSLASVGYHLLTHRVPADRPVSISTAMELLEKGDYDAARLIAQQLQEAIFDEYQPSGASFYVQGSILTKEAAELLPGEKRRTIYLIAAHYLEQARDRGFPPGHEQEGLYLLSSQLVSGRHVCTKPARTSGSL